ncbi:MAG: CopG family transcriptional regulator [Mycobacteriales bacterium]
MKRTTVFADEADLAIIKAAAVRRGVAEAELIRDAIHLAAMAHRTWDEPFFTRTYSCDAGSPRVRAEDVLHTAWTDEAEAYERTKGSTS